MEQSPENLLGMGAAEAREYIAGHIASLKLTEKQYEELNRDCEKWSARVELARSRNNEALAAEASVEAEKQRERRDALGAEIAVLKRQIERMREQLPGLAARERSIDPDLLEQELLIALGHTPGDGTVTEESARKRRFEELDADAALEALKAKMRQGDTA
jgi:phage shock protein A